jgi:uncharacterized membrane protein
MVIVMPYATRTLGVPLRRVLREALLPPLLPAVPTAAVLFLLREAVKPASLLPLVLLGGIALALYIPGYFLLAAGELERTLGAGLILRLRGMASATH